MSLKLSSLKESDFLLLSVQLAVERIVIALLNSQRELKYSLAEALQQPRGF